MVGKGYHEADTAMVTLLSWQMIKKTDCLPGTLVSKEIIMHEYKDAFEGLGCMSQQYHIEIQQDATPVVHPPRKVRFTLNGKLKETLDSMKEKEDHYQG